VYCGFGLVPASNFAIVAYSIVAIEVVEAEVEVDAITTATATTTAIIIVRVVVAVVVALRCCLIQIYQCYSFGIFQEAGAF
jgi:hypothetical protein